MSGGPSAPCGADWPGKGAPPGPLPPPSTSDGAVGSGPVGVLEVVDEEDEFVVVFVPPGGVGAGVIVKIIVDVNVVCTRPGPKPTNVVRDVERITDAVPLLGVVAFPGAVTLPAGVG